MSQVRRHLTISAEVDQSLTQMAHESGTPTSEIVCKALTLYILAVEKKREGMRLGFVKQGKQLETEVIGL